jgi:transcriptional antiterminator RfaH
VARIHLERQGYVCFYPTITVEKIRRGKLLKVEEALFPRYVFIQLDSSLDAPSWAPIRSTQGVSTLVRFGNDPARVDADIIESLQKQPASTEALFKTGETVVVTEGAFAGLNAIYQTQDGERRSLILLEIMHKSVLVKVDTQGLREMKYD